MNTENQNIQLYLAPLKGFTDYIFRNTYSRYFDGFDGAVAPFLSTLKTIRAKPAYLKDVLPENNSAMSIEPQIIGNNPENFVPLATQLFDMGYNTVNWNLGCPYPMVAKKQRGSGLLPFPEKIDMFLKETVPVIPNDLSIKCRLGLKSPGEILKIMPIFNQYPLKKIIIHPRTGKQMYDGKPDPEAFEECLNLSRHPVIYNGDITDLKSFRKIAGRFNTINHWMIGRGAIANPFLPAILKAGKDTFTNKVITFKQFYADLYAEYRRVLQGPGHLLERMKGFWTYFSQSFQNGHEIRKKIHRTHIHKRYQEIVERFFETEAEWLD